MHLLARLLAPILLLAAATSTQAASWPGPAPCAGTLQACIDAQPAGGEVLIVTTAPIDESITLLRSITLAAAPGIEARFAPRRGILGDFYAAGPLTLRLRRLSFENAGIMIGHVGDGAVDMLLEDLDLVQTDNVATSLSVDLATPNAAPQLLRIHRSRIRLLHAPALNNAALRVVVLRETATVDLRWNTIEAGAPGEGWGVLVDGRNGATVTARLLGNEVRGGFGRAGIAISEGSSGGAGTIVAELASNAVIGHHGRIGGGLQVKVHDGSIDARLINNTVVNSDRGIDLGVRPTTTPAAGSIGGQLFNNLVAHNRYGITVHPTAVSGLSSDYNLRFDLSNDAGTLPAGANEVNAHPLLRAIEAPRLQPGSPARNAGNGFALLAVPMLAGHDGDGLRRVVGSAVDIGAYEFGHRSVAVLKQANNGDSFTAVDDAAIDADRNARLFPTGNFSAGGVSNFHPSGVFDLFDQWWVRNADGAAMPTGTAYNLFSAQGVGSTGVRQHAATGSNTLGGASLIDWAFVNDRPDHILLFAQASPLGTPTHPGAVALRYAGGRWELVATDGSEFTSSTLWNLYAQAPSPNAFRHTVAASGSSSLLDHPLLNNTRCARVHAVPLAHGGSNGIVFDVEYRADLGRWRLFSGNGTFSAGAQFNIVVLPEQVEQCTFGRLFRDSFEANRYEDE